VPLVGQNLLIRSDDTKEISRTLKSKKDSIQWLKEKGLTMMYKTLVVPGG